MTKEKAKELVTQLLWTFQKARSNMIEGIGGFGKGWDDLSTVEQSVLRTVHPGLFAEAVNIIDVLERIESKDEVESIDLYNVLVCVEVSWPELEAIVSVMGIAGYGHSIKLPRVDQGVPKWIAGFDS